MKTVTLVAWVCLVIGKIIPDGIVVANGNHSTQVNEIEDFHTFSDDAISTPPVTSDTNLAPSATQVAPPADQPDYIENTIARNVDLYGIGFVLFFGVFGNILSLLVLTRARLRARVPSVYLTAMAISDLVTLMLGLAGRHWARAVSGYDTVNESDWWCKSWFFSVGLSAHYSNWVLMSLSIDRCIAVLRPMKAKKWLTRSHAVIVLVVMFVCLAALHSHAFAGHKSIILPSGFRACIPVAIGPFTPDVKDWMLFVLRAVIPGALIVICNGLIIKTLVRASAIRTELAGDQSSEGTQLRSLVLMLISISVAFVVLTSPVHIQWVLSAAFPADYAAASRAAATNRMKWALFLLLLYANCAINFVLYLVSGREFRQELRNLLLMCCKKTSRGSAGKTASNSLSGSGAASSELETQISKISSPVNQS